ncbi:MAG: hypothetical protein IJY23_04630, partial [Clostridia bacterium]|nr:hypothetical protein [Clostridia bacterium]
FGRIPNENRASAILARVRLLRLRHGLSRPSSQPKAKGTPRGRPFDLIKLVYDGKLLACDKFARYVPLNNSTNRFPRTTQDTAVGGMRIGISLRENS